MRAIIMPETAMVLAAGFGRRMQPLTSQIPKPLIQVAGKALIDHVLDRLASSGIRRVIVNTSYKGEMIEKHLSNTLHSFEILFSREAEPLETGGGIKKALPLIGDFPFFAVNSDTLWMEGFKSALARLAQYFDEKKMDSLLLLIPTAKAIGYNGSGDFFACHDMSLRKRREAEIAPFVFGGLQLMHPRLVRDFPAESFPLSALFNQAGQKNSARIYGIPHDGTWMHVGDPASIYKAEAALM